jgi:hypothetical protein
MALAEYEWRSYLLEKGLPPTYSRVHLFITDVSDGSQSQPIPNFSQYFARVVDQTIAYSEVSAFVYCKFSRFIVIGEITHLDQDDFEGTRVYPCGGVLRIPQSMMDGKIGEFMLNRASIMQRSVEAMSERQKRKVSDFLAKNVDRIAASDLGRILVADQIAVVKPIEKPE